MIISQLNGGLGNQLFQYAFGRTIALKNKTYLIIDKTRFGPQGTISNIDEQSSLGLDLITRIKKKLRNFKKRYYSLGKLDHYHIDTVRTYGLKYFNIQEKELNWAIILGLRIKKKLGLSINIIDKEHEQSFNIQNLEIKNNSYLIGYWQSPKYFNDMKDKLTEELSVSTSPNKYNKKILHSIKNESSVSIHVRRGDYIKHQTHNQNFGTCDMEYYNRSISYIKDKVPNASFYIFSDDPDWAEEYINVQGSKRFISRNDQSLDYEDLRLMYSCKHNITANSTFSWWGAYLNQNKNKIILTPKLWFINPSWSDKDLVPNEWIRI
jgi:hypothetical protein